MLHGLQSCTVYQLLSDTLYCFHLPWIPYPSSTCRGSLILLPPAMDPLSFFHLPWIPYPSFTCRGSLILVRTTLQTEPGPRLRADSRFQRERLRCRDPCRCSSRSRRTILQCWSASDYSSARKTLHNRFALPQHLPLSDTRRSRSLFRLQGRRSI